MIGSMIGIGVLRCGRWSCGRMRGGLRDLGLLLLPHCKCRMILVMQEMVRASVWIVDLG
jgi:hypothetical protein